MKSKPTVSGSVNHEVTDPNGLTLGSLIDAVLRDKTDSRYYTRCRGLDMEKARLETVFASLERESGKKVMIDPADTRILLLAVVLPTEDEWDAVE